MNKHGYLLLLLLLINLDLLLIYYIKKRKKKLETQETIQSIIKESKNILFNCLLFVM